MSKDLPHVRNHVADTLAISSSTTAYGPSHIHSRLNVEQQLIDTETAKGSPDVALAATKVGSSTQPSCGNCGRTGHVIKDCFGKGGAMEGKCDQVLERKHAGRSTSKPAATGKPGGLHYDTGGRAYLLDSETHEAIYVASAQKPPTETNMATQEFAGLASDTLTPAFIREISASDEDKYTTLLAAVDPLQTSLDWCHCSRSVDFAGITYKPPNQHTRTIVDPSIIPFFLNSGASVHISNSKADFYSLRPVPPRTVNGVGGSSIQAVGVGTIHLII
ncbi:uncharacterized protein EDB93DRAFT_1095732, partial [Suillus bovinus]|uniref:uncharacterized protein n=1 Tax=Suillus bovinus TaxID=48563 RepID=UPI001B882197